MAKYKLNDKLMLKYLDEGKTLQDYALYELDTEWQNIRNRVSRTYGKEFYSKIAEMNRINRGLDKIGEQIISISLDLDKVCSEGLSYTGISKEYPISGVTVRKYVKRKRPDLHEVFERNGLINHSSNDTLTKEQLEEINRLSSEGIGIDTIGRKFGKDGTTIRYRLIKMLGEEEYKRRHSKDKFTNNNGWNGKSIPYNGNTYQSNSEVEVAKILEGLELEFKTHTRVTIGGKIYYPGFYLPQLNIFIEFAGMLNKSFYRRKFAKKVSDYSMNNIKCLVVVDETLDVLKSTLEEMMPYVTKCR